MSGPVRIRLSRAKGWRMPADTVRASRPGPWGNPFDFRESAHCWTALTFGCRGDRLGRQAASVKAYRDWVDPGEGRRVKEIEFQFGMERKDGSFFGLAPRVTAGLAPSHAEIRTSLEGKNLACWCRLCPAHQEGKPLGLACAACEPCHADVLGEIANRPVCVEAAA